MLAASYGKKEFPYYTYDFHYEDFSYYIVYDFEKASTAINMQKKTPTVVKPYICIYDKIGNQWQSMPPWAQLYVDHYEQPKTGFSISQGLFVIYLYTICTF